MIRVYQVISDTNIGGAGRYLLNYVKYFDRRKYQVTVLIPENSQLKPFLQAYDDITVKEVPYMADKSYDKRCVRAMQEIFSCEKVDIVHTHASLSARIAARKAKVGKILSTRHCIEPKGRFPVSTVKSVLNNLLCDIYIAVSDAVLENLRRCGIKQEKIRLVCNGVSPVEKLADTEIQRTKEHLGIGDETVFGIFARLEEVKGHKYFIEAAKKFIKKGGKGTFLIVGDGALAESLKEQAKGFPQIRFTGYVNDTTSLLNVTDVNVISSSSEAMSLAILEAMSLAKPTIATNVGGNPQLVQHFKNGILTAYQDIDDLAEAFLKMSEDRAFYEECANSAQADFFARYTANIMVDNLEKLYEEVTNERE